MRLRCCDLEFRPGLWASLALLAALPVLLSLGRWQLDRAAEKEALLADFAAAREAPAVGIAALDGIAASAEGDREPLQYRDLSLRGRLDGERQLLLDNRVYQHRAGFEVLTLLHLLDGRALLVNRGWVAPGASRAELPDVSLRAGDRRGGEAVVEGIFVRPSRAFALGDALAGDRGGWPRIVQYYDFTALGALLRVDLIPAVLYLDAGHPAALVHNWRPLPEGPEKHYSYATQWFAMAGVVLILYFTLNTRRLRRGERERD